MAGYRQLISEKRWLHVQARARALMGTGTDLLAILYKDRRLIFKTASGTYGKRVIWTQTVELNDATLQNILAAKSFKDIETLIRESDLKISCTCPAWTYWGYKYMAWKRGYGLERETRRPRVRNPHERGFLCKHLYLVLSLYPFWAPALAKKFKSWAESKEGAITTGISNFQAPRMNRGNQKFVNKLSNPNTGVNQPSFVNDSNSTMQINQTSQISSLN